MRAKIIISLPECGSESLAQALCESEYQIATTLDNAPSHLVYVGPAHTKHLREAIEAKLLNYYIEYHCIQPPIYSIDVHKIKDMQAFNTALSCFQPVKGIQYAFRNIKPINAIGNECLS